MKKPYLNADIDKLFDELFISMNELERKTTFARHLLMAEELDFEKITSACIEVDAQAKDIKFLSEIITTSLNLIEMEQKIYGSRI
jgi:hypothetical protein